jgi:hypothetical protein
MYSATSTSRAENELTLEAAMGLASEKKPFTSDWSGYVGEGGLLVRELAFKATYHDNSYFSYSITFGFLDDYDKARTWAFSASNLGGQPVSIRKVSYVRPTVKIAVDLIKVEMGVVFFKSVIDSFEYIFKESVFPIDRKSRPSFELGFGQKNFFLYFGFLNSLPISTTGIIEMGIKGMIHDIYEHKIFTSMTDYQDFSLGYRGEFRVYKNIAITPGFSIGGRDRENVYMMTIGIKSLIDL